MSWITLAKKVKTLYNKTIKRLKKETEKNSGDEKTAHVFQSILV